MTDSQDLVGVLNPKQQLRAELNDSVTHVEHIISKLVDNGYLVDQLNLPGGFADIIVGQITKEE